METQLQHLSDASLYPFARTNASSGRYLRKCTPTYAGALACSMHACMCIHTHTQTHTQAHTQTQTQTHNQAHSCTTRSRRPLAATSGTKLPPPPVPSGAVSSASPATASELTYKHTQIRECVCVCVCARARARADRWIHRNKSSARANR